MIQNFKNFLVDRIATACMAIMIYWDDIVDTIVTCVVSVVICLFFVNFVFMPVRVDGSSMYPQLKNNQIGFANVLKKNTSEIQRFDIVVIYQADKDENLVKRVIGLPNETVTFIGDHLYINHQLVKQDFLDENYVAQQIQHSFTGNFTDDFEIQLKDDEYFCLGDNRLVSLDSRYYGPFHLDEIKANGVFILFPFADFGLAK